MSKSVPLLVALLILTGCGSRPTGVALSTTKNADGLAEADLHIPFYPGSQDAGPGQSLDQKLKGRRNLGVRRTTTDDPAKVVAFYRGKLKDAKHKSRTIGQNAFETVSSKLEDGTEVLVKVEPKEGRTLMTLLSTLP